MAKENKKILVVEDEKPMAKALELKLSRAGFDVKTVFDGEAGLSLLEKESFSLVICDLLMPKMDGFKFLEEVKNRNISTPVIILSNLSQREDEKRAISLGAKAFFVKSDTPIAEIVARVKEIIEK